jgi:S1/P1 Nuclease
MQEGNMERQDKRVSGGFGLLWNFERHQLIAAAAESQMTNETAKAAVGALLERLNARTLAEVAVWADRITSGRPKNDNHPETIAFFENEANHNNAPWHFVNFPYESGSYDCERLNEFCREDDVVHITRECIRVFAAGSTRFSRANALRLLIHFVGDLHQPLHVGCSFVIDPDGDTKLTGDPDVTRRYNLESDKGGNRLLVDLPGRPRLHSYWDSGFENKTLPEDDIVRLTPDSVEELRISGQRTKQILDTSPETWPAQWASQSLRVAAGAYSQLSVKQRIGSRYLLNWPGEDEYRKVNDPVVNRQMADAAARLAALLDLTIS